MPKDGLPRVGLPPSPAAQPPASTMTKPRVPPPGAISPNWLVDAMQKQEASRELRRNSSRDRSNLRGEPKAGNPAEDRDATRSEAKEQGIREEEETQSVFNPLTGYLDDWMTPRDYALLKPALTAPLMERAIPLMSAAEMSIPAAGLNEVLRGAGIPAGQRAPERPRENPFLESLKLDLPAASVPHVAKQPAPQPVLSRPVSPPVIQPPSTAPAQGKMPDFAKPSDEKYFKQLKRF